LVVNIFQGDEEQELTALVEEGLCLLAYDALGGQGSRGYGRVQIQLDARHELAAADFSSDQKLSAALRHNLMAKPLSRPIPERMLETEAA
jgi:CRISPR/Cas system CSM-associated protein Csm3 (group 7 of RAMP superfamily)